MGCRGHHEGMHKRSRRQIGLGHDWCNCDFKRTKSYTNAIVTNSSLYREFDRLIVRMVNLDLLLAMKLVAFREHKQSDLTDCMNIIRTLAMHGEKVDSNYMVGIVIKYYGRVDILSNGAKAFIGLE